MSVSSTDTGHLPVVVFSIDIPNLEVLQMTSSMSQSKVAKILNRLSGEGQQAIRNELAKVESAFDHSFVASELGKFSLSIKFDC